MSVAPLAPIAAIDAIVDKGDAAYGINTGFGKLAKTRIPDDQLEQLQRNLILSHAVGTGEPMHDAAVRLLLLMKAGSLARGYSGARPLVVYTLLALLKENFWSASRPAHSHRTTYIGVFVALAVITGRSVGSRNESLSDTTGTAVAGRGSGATTGEPQHAERREVELVDGVKVFHADGWVLCRPDPGEPLTHIWAEGDTEPAARRLAEEYTRRIRQLMR